MSDPDLLKIKIEKARGELSEDTRRAIDAVDWKAAILGMRETKGYNFEQLGDLETETELLLSGLLSPKDYPKELEARMRIPKAKAEELVNEMNMLVFSKIREEMIRNAERTKVFEQHPLKTGVAPISISPVNKVVNVDYPVKAKQINKEETQVLHEAGIKIIDPEAKPAEVQSVPVKAAPEPVKQAVPDLTKLELPAGEKTVEKSEEKMTPPILAQKLSTSFQVPTVKTEHTDSGDVGKPTTPISKPKSYPEGEDPYRVSPE